MTLVFLVELRARGVHVTSDVPANTIAGGIPARVIRELEIPDPAHYVRPR